jgi:hypothetical protein
MVAGKHPTLRKWTTAVYPVGMAFGVLLYHWGAKASSDLKLVNDLGTVVATGCLLALSKLLWDWVLYRLTLRKPFDEFFGDGAAECAETGIILLPTDNIECAIPELGEKLDGDAKHRWHKARMLSNHYDAIGAMFITNYFQSEGFAAPKVLLIEHHRRGRHDVAPPTDAPFIISMGLGFTDDTVQIVKDVCKKWMRIEVREGVGDAVELKTQLVSPELKYFKRQLVVTEPDWTRLDPIDWDVKKWKAGADGQRDYALIFRHTRIKEDKRQVLFALGGFTEIGTAAAAHYLASHWRELGKKMGCNHPTRDSMGDFALLIEGPANPSDFDRWQVDVHLPAITPARLASLCIDCEWADRLKSPARISESVELNLSNP